MENIKRGTFISEYVGEIITNEEAERRGKAYDSDGMTYLFDLVNKHTDYLYYERMCLMTSSIDDAPK